MKKSTSLFELLTVDEGTVYFENSRVAPGGSSHLYIPSSVWEEFGKPHELTVAIRPGSHVGDM